MPTYKPTIQQLDSNAVSPEGPSSREVDDRMSTMDRDLAEEMAKMLMNNPKMAKSYDQIRLAKNPAGPLAFLLAQSILGVRDKMISKGLLTNDKIWAAENGVIDNLIHAEDGSPWERHGIEVNPFELKKYTFDVLSKFDEAGEQSKTNKSKPEQAQQQQATSAPQMPPGAALGGGQ